MPSCPECESPISANEPFCPVCGIALGNAAQPEQVPEPKVEAAKEEPPAEDEFDGTLMMSPEELAALVANKGSAPKVEDKPVVPAPEPVIETPPEPEQTIDEILFGEGSSKSPGTSPAEAHTQSPAIAEQKKDTSGNIKVRSTADYTLEQQKTLETLEEQKPEVQSPALPEVFPNSSIVDDIPFEPAPELNPEIVPENLPSFLVDDPFVPPVDIPDDPAVISPSLFEDEPVPEIAKPGFDLPEYQQENPIYDSVRIVAPEPPDEQAFVATRIPSSRNLNEPRGSSAEEERPHTTPNFDAGTSSGKKSSKLKPLTEGAILNNRYEIIRKIGGGGMGAVYLASDNNLGGVLRAVKEMVQAHIEDDQQEKAINDFKRESMILSSLDHPAIPTIFDYFYDESECRFYLVMKYISGGDLAARIRSTPEGKIDEATVTEWALQIIDVLNYLHNQPSTIVYRDLKPSNIMIDGNSGRIMLIDFGIARSIGQKEEKGVTAVGTMGYAPPELFSGNVEPRSDIYSLGSTMFHLLTGADPQSNPLLIFDFQKNPRPRQINPRLSDQIERILMKSVEYSADARFASAADMRQVLEQHLANLRAGNVTYGVGEVPASVALDDQTVFCGFCGQRIVATDMFCAFCGSRQPIAQQGVHLAPAPKTTVTAKLLIEGTTELAMPAFALQKEENLLGRRDPMSNIFPEVDLSKYDPQTKISRRHARIWKQGDRFLVEDLGSSNGTLLAGGGAAAVRLTPHKPQLLASGDRIKLGDTTLYFVVD
ncbi:MAG: protein kinase domain-containing protein [Pyrinomonadaceae bacterium]